MNRLPRKRPDVASYFEQVTVAALPLAFAVLFRYKNAMTDLPLTPPKPSIPEILMTLFLRGVALMCLLYAVRIWGEVTGYSDGGRLRFDLLSSDMMAVKATLSVLYPVAAVGLWLKGPWGPVIWSAASGLEIVLYQAFPQIFGAHPAKVATIALIVLAYMLLRLATMFFKPHKAPGLHG